MTTWVYVSVAHFHSGAQSNLDDGFDETVGHCESEIDGMLHLHRGGEIVHVQHVVGARETTGMAYEIEGPSGNASLDTRYAVIQPDETAHCGECLAGLAQTLVREGVACS